ncbi:MAG: sigma-54-dependent Fis family transcriptional regulator [Deltaproteobacteria bacterium]|nr:sigma-54-dependent Fis family transcriptional regulator [Deltaproteobacteria bacterium]
MALIVDDEESICSTLEGIFSDEGWESLSVRSGLEAVRVFQKHLVDLVLLDVWMPGLDGIQTLQKLRDLKADVPVVIMSGHGTIETAVKATRLGAFDYLEKPLSLEKLIPLIEHAGKIRQLRHGETQAISKDFRLIGESEAMAAIHRKIKVIAPRNSWVLITGENGTGKEVVARNIHLQSPRVNKSFVAVNCAAIPEELIESELFGHAKGAFTNAVSLRRGKFEQAHQGTLFLDEIADMSLKTQAKILRILQEQSFERLGDSETIDVNVRVLAATNKNLQEEIEAGRFREDLYYRLNVIPVHVPPLRERPGDIPVLAEFFLREMGRELGERPKQLSFEALRAMESYSWPGNVRELRNLIERLSILAAGDYIDRSELPEMIRLPEGAAAAGGEWESDLSQLGSTLKEARSSFERSFIMEKLEEYGWNVSRTAEAIGVERSNLHRKLRIYGIDAKRLKL